MAIKTLLAARQVISYQNGTRGCTSSTLVMGRVEKLLDEGVLEFVPYSNFSSYLVFRDVRTGVYLQYQKIDMCHEGMLERLTAAVPKARASAVNVYTYATQFKQAHFSDLPPQKDLRR